MNIGIYTNCNKDIDLAVTKRLLSVLRSDEFNVFLDRDLSTYNLTEKYFDKCGRSDLDLMLTVGGDGTILRIASFCAKNGIAILGVNLGTVGFMTEFEVSALDGLVPFLKSDESVREKRSLLSAKINKQNIYALNDFVLSRRSSDRMIAVAVHIDGELADKYYCDGFIVSTPTGSTAYSLSAGGCIISPTTHAFSLLPINSHSLHSRPIVVDDSSEIRITLLSSDDDCDIVCDGNPVGTLERGQSLTVGKAKQPLVFLRLKKSNFYEKLLSKLNTWSVTIK